MGSNTIRQTWTIDGGEITLMIETENPIPASVLAKLGELCEELGRFAVDLDGDIAWAKK